MIRWISFLFVATFSCVFGAPANLTVDGFQEALRSPKVVVVDVYADWCGACKSFAPVFKQASEEFSKNFRFFKVNADQQGKLVKQLQITGLPTTIFFKNGVEVAREVGSMSADYFAEKLRSLE